MDRNELLDELKEKSSKKNSGKSAVEISTESGHCDVWLSQFFYRTMSQGRDVSLNVLEDVADAIGYRVTYGIERVEA